MKQLPKSCLLQSNFFLSKKKHKSYLALAFFFNIININAQYANYISNGSFEENYYNCSGPAFPLMIAKSWLSIDSSSFGGLYLSKCNSLVPMNGSGFQQPKSKNSYVITTWYYFNSTRGYPKNRLKKNLQAGKVYCVKFHVNITNKSPYGMDGFGAYFGDGSIDTIKKCTVPLTYINPQVKNPLGNVITDTLNWVPITGTFTANGTEKYMLLGNFLADNAVTTASIGGPYYPQLWTDVLIDDVSCIEADAPAYAGPDKYVLAGDSVYIGRERDFAVDPYCVWYQLPNATSIDTTSGIWVKPTQTTTYVVQQNLECGSLKWDTVVVRVGYTGNVELEMLNDKLKIYPTPANEMLNVVFTSVSSGQSAVGSEQLEGFVFEIINSLGQVIREEELQFKEGKAIIDTKDLESGVYLITLSSRSLRSLSTDSSFVGMTGTVSKRFVVNH